MKRISFLSFSLVWLPGLQAIPFSHLGFPSRSTVVKMAVAGTTLAAFGTYAYEKLQKYLDDKIINDSVEAVTLACTPYIKLLALPKEKREEALKKKARLIVLRKNILDKLKFHAESDSALSGNHRAQLQSTIQQAETFFGFIDTIRLSNKYEETYVHSWVDSALEYDFSRSIILGTKPDEECSQKELLQKKHSAQRRAVIVKKLQERGSQFVASGLLSSAPLIFRMLLA